MKKLFFLSLLFLLFYFQSVAQGWFPLQTYYSQLKATNPIRTICADDNLNLYAAGSFTDAITNKFYVAKWDNVTHQWSELGSGSNALNANQSIAAIAVDKSGNVYAGGAFTDGATAFTGFKYVAKWDGVTWNQMGTGVNALNATGAINSICIDDSGNIYAAGNFLNAFGYCYVSKWNGTTWSELPGLNANLFINSICVDHSLNVYAAGTFSDSAGHKYVAKWNYLASSWSELGNGFDSGNYHAYISSINVDNLYNIVTGVNFIDTVTSVFTSNVYKWDGASWSILGGISNALNANNNIESMCNGDSGYIYVSGEFTNGGGKTYVAQFNPISNTWGELGAGSYALYPHSIGYGNHSPIIALCTDTNHHIYAAGAFTDSVSATDDYMYVAEYGPASLNIESIRGDDIEIKVYPNPTRETVNIKCYKDAENYSISYELLDCIGRVWNSGDCTAEDTRIDISRLPIGLYILAIGGIEFKIIKN